MKLSSIAWNAAGLGAPLVVAVVTLKPLLTLLGQERYGLLSLAWGLTAVAGLFDLGVGRATTRVVAEQIGRGELHKTRATLKSSVRIAGGVGTAAGAVFALAICAHLYRALNFSPALDTEVFAASLLLALCIPLQATIATYRGVCEALQRFRGISLLRMALGVANFGLPLAIAQFTTHLAWLLFGLLAARCGALLAFRLLALNSAPLPASQPAPPPNVDIRGLLAAGGWFTVSACIGAVFVQADRFFIGAKLSAAAVTTYTVPFDLVTQLLIGVTAISTVTYPTIATQLHTNPAAARTLFLRWLYIVTVGMAVLMLVVAVLLPTVLQLWLGHLLPPESVSVGRWLCLGVWINAIGTMLFAFLHAQARYRETAFLHIVELPIYVVALLALLHIYGVEGAAIAWTARVVVDTAILSVMASKKL